MQRRGGFFGLLAIAALIASCLVASAAQAALPTLRPTSTGARPFTGFSEWTVYEFTASGEFVGMHTECGTDSLKGSFAATNEGQAATLSGAHLSAESCVVESSSGEKISTCSARDSVNKKTGFFETNKLNGKFVWLKEKAPAKESEEEAGVVFWPEAEGSSPTGKEPLVTIEVIGAGCPVAGSYPIKGTVVGKVTSPVVGSMAATMTIEFPAKPITVYTEGESPRTKHSAGLKVGEGAVNMSSIEKVSLGSEEKFGVFRE